MNEYQSVPRPSTPTRTNQSPIALKTLRLEDSYPLGMALFQPRCLGYVPLEILRLGMKTRGKGETM